jgi:hypothetical protein
MHSIEFRTQSFRHPIPVGRPARTSVGRSVVTQAITPTAYLVDFYWLSSSI